MRPKKKRTEHGPSFENSNPGAGCNSTHVARARAKWGRRKNRSLHRNGKVTSKFGNVGGEGNLTKLRMYDDDLEEDVNLEYDDFDVEELCKTYNIILDCGNLIDSPFIPDGEYRIYRKDNSLRILGSGLTAQAAWADFKLRNEE